MPLNPMSLKRLRMNPPAPPRQLAARRRAVAVRTSFEGTVGPRFCLRDSLSREVYALAGAARFADAYLALQGVRADLEAGRDTGLLVPPPPSARLEIVCLRDPARQAARDGRRAQTQALLTAPLCLPPGAPKPFWDDVFWARAGRFSLLVLTALLLAAYLLLGRRLLP